MATPPWSLSFRPHMGGLEFFAGTVNLGAMVGSLRSRCHALDTLGTCVGESSLSET